MSPELAAPRERKCNTCAHYGFKRGNPKGYRWACCNVGRVFPHLRVARQTRRQVDRSGIDPYIFPDDEEYPGERKGCEDWQ